MTRRSTLIPTLLPISLLLAAATTQADMAVPATVRATTLIEMGATGAPNAVVTTDGKVVFRNRVSASTRIVFASKDASAFDCYADGEEVVRSRSSQYLLRGGAELACTVRPGSYRYTTLTQQRGGIHKSRPTLRVRN